MSSPADAVSAKKRMPGWLSMPGGPSEPNHAAFRAAMSKYSEEKRTLIAEVRALRASLGPREGREEAEREREEMRQRLGEIDAQRKAEQEQRFRKNEEIQAVKKAHDERVAKLRDLSEELGAFQSIAEIDEAIAYVTRRMETGGGGLSEERRAVQQLARLESAKKYLLELQPLSEAIAEAKHREAVLQREWQEINERVRHLNGAYSEQRVARQQREQNARASGADRQAVFKQCDALNARIAAIHTAMNEAREAHTKQVEAWNAWRDEARERYAAKVEAERKERARRLLERRNAAKLEGKRTRAAKRQNPYEAEIGACTTLERYLRDQRMMLQREEAERAKHAAAVDFDPAAHLPPGAVVLNDGKKAGDSKRPIVKGKKQPQPQPQRKKEPAKNRVLQHSEEKVRLFHLIGEEPPLALAAIDAAVERILAKQKEYESHIRTGELELSSEDEEEEQEEEEVTEKQEEEREVPTEEGNGAHGETAEEK